MTNYDLYGAMESAYFRNQISNGVHFVSSFLEKQVRLAACLAFSELVLTDSAVRIPRSTGLGGYLAVMHEIAEHCRAEGINPEVDKLCRAMAKQFNRFADDANDRTIKDYRDYLAHGGIEPSGGTLYDALVQAKNDNARVIRGHIECRGGVQWLDDQLSLTNEISLYPLIIIAAGDVAIFQSADDQCMTYYTLNPERPTIEFRSSDRSEKSVVEDLTKFLRAAPSREDRRNISLYKQSVSQDLRGFREPGIEPEFIGVYSPFDLQWARTTSEGCEFRTDRFRVNSNSAREWLSPSGWVAYTSFLKAISNWGVIVRRSLDRLNAIAEEYRRIEGEQFTNLSSLEIPDLVSTKFLVRDVLGSSFASGEKEKPVDIEHVIDQSATNFTGVPQVFFVTGEAGIGKTYSLFKSSRDRAQALVADADADFDDKPMYLYISCSGVGLKKMDDIINAAVVETRNLTFDSVLALSRNGLLVLVIDGFDELVGGTGYGDAFHLLRPVLERLGSSGTLLLSARSSYFANQYQKSLRTAEEIDHVPAHHLVLEVQRWSRSDIELLFAANAHWAAYRNSLNHSDFALLGVPFFAQAFNEATSEPSSFAHFQGLRSTLIDSYLAREIRKLENRGGQTRVTKGQLRAIFQEVAGLLYESGESSLDLDDFKLACETALEIDGFHGPNQALGDRLTVLCGMSASTDKQGVALFSFQHDIFFEVLLADHLGNQYLGSTQGHKSMLAALGGTTLGDATVSSMTERYQEPLADFLGEPIVSEKDPDSTLSINIAALVCSLVENFGCSPSDWFQDINFKSIDLRPLSRLNLTFANCHFDRFCFDSSTSGALTLRDCSITHLEVHGDSAEPFSKLTFEGEITIQEASTCQADGKVSEFETGVIRVIELLGALGANGVADKLQAIHESKRSPLESFAVEVLRGMSARGENSYIVEARSRIPGNTAGRGMLRPSEPLWAELTDALGRAKVATIKPITASGAPKLVVAFNFTASTICERESGEPKVREFWGRLSSA